MRIRKLVWLFLTGLAVAALLLASCGPEEEEEEEQEQEEEEEEEQEQEEEEEEEEGPAKTREVTMTKLDGSKVTRTLEIPQYGGTIRTSLQQTTQNYDPAGPGFFPDPIVQYNVYETMTICDWTRGPAGTNEDPGFDTRTEEMYWIPWLAESFEMPDPKTLIYHVREGVHFHDKPPVNGRLLTVDDVVESIKRCARLAGGSQIREALGDSIEKGPDNTVVIKTVAAKIAPIRLLSWLQFIYAPEIVGDNDKVAWEDAVGTGPYMLTDHIGGTSATLTRNDNYWAYDPLFPENQLPYADKIISLIISEPATRLAALRTGKIDRVVMLTWEDAKQLMETTPDLQWNSGPGTAVRVYFRVDKGGPLANREVRRALCMALDRESILEDYLEGQGDLDWYPIPPDSTLIYTPTDEKPEDLQELFEYNPEKAKQLLADAGYGGGFTLDVLYSDIETQKEYFLVLQKAWEDIGVTAAGRFLPKAAAMAEGYARNYDVYFWESGSGGRQGNQFFYSGSPSFGSYCRFSYWWGVDEDGSPTYYNAEDDAMIQKCNDATYPDPGYQYQKEAGIYFLNQVYDLAFPRPYLYIAWWPWLKGYYGEPAAGQTMTFEGLYPHCWVDQDLKADMGY